MHLDDLEFAYKRSVVGFGAIIGLIWTSGTGIKMFNLKKIYKEFPRKFWLVVGVSFIDHVGGTMLFPFFALYITATSSRVSYPR